MSLFQRLALPAAPQDRVFDLFPQPPKRMLELRRALYRLPANSSTIRQPDLRLTLA